MKTHWMHLVSCAAVGSLALTALGQRQRQPVAANGEAVRAAVYTKDKPPATPKLEDLELKDSLSEYGITWTFEKPARVGQFVNGDWYVVGPVTVKMIDPKPRYGDEVAADELDGQEKKELERNRLSAKDMVRNGSMLNPPAKQEVAYDSGIKNWFTPALAAKLPIPMQPGDSLVSTISFKLEEKPDYPYHVGGRRASGDNSPVRTAAVLTCLAAPQPPDAFRPGFCDRQQKIYLARDLHREMLKGLPRPNNTPKLATWVRVFQRPWVNTGFFGFEQPMENMPQYGQWVGQAQSMGGLMLMLDFPPEQKEALLDNMVQVGIDYWGAVQSGHPGWEGWGGHGSGRKFPIVLAGILLGDEQMASPTRSFPKVNFGEDNQTTYGESWTGAKVCFAGHSGIHADGSIPRKPWGPYENLNPSQWDKNGMSNMQSEAYRRANSSSSWPGQALVIQMLGGQKQWNHDAFFDYVDRWMLENDKEFRQEINKHFPDKNLVDESSTWYHQGQAWEAFVTDLWKEYRTAPGMPPTDGWKKGKP